VIVNRRFRNTGSIKDSIDNLCSVFYCYPKYDTDEGNFICFSIYEMDVWIIVFIITCWCRRGRDRMVVGFTATNAISADHH
jgi:hypothetical protein